MSQNAAYEKRAAQWPHVLAQITVAGFCIYWCFHLPAPNKAVLILTGVTVVIALLNIHPSQKAIYLLLVIWLMFIENSAINHDRADNLKDEDDHRQVENAKFQAIADGLTGAIENSHREFNVTMSQLNMALDRVGDSIKTQTGGDSFAYVTFTPEPNQQFLVAITSHGKYPLREIHVTMIDEERESQAMQEFNKHPEENWTAVIQAGETYFHVPYLRPQSPQGPSGDVEMLGAYPFGAKETNDLTIAFSSLNGDWDERLHLRRVNGKWHQALSVWGPTPKQALHPFIYCDPDYPEGKALAEKDWPRVKPQTRHK
jgi:hypothetical protein